MASKKFTIVPKNYFQNIYQTWIYNLVRNCRNLSSTQEKGPENSNIQKSLENLYEIPGNLNLSETFNNFFVHSGFRDAKIFREKFSNEIRKLDLEEEREKEQKKQNEKEKEENANDETQPLKSKDNKKPDKNLKNTKNPSEKLSKSLNFIKSHIISELKWTVTWARKYQVFYYFFLRTFYYISVLISPILIGKFLNQMEEYDEIFNVNKANNATLETLNQSRNFQGDLSNDLPLNSSSNQVNLNLLITGLILSLNLFISVTLMHHTYAYCYNLGWQLRLALSAKIYHYLLRIYKKSLLVFLLYC